MFLKPVFKNIFNVNCILILAHLTFKNFLPVGIWSMKHRQYPESWKNCYKKQQSNDVKQLIEREVKNFTVSVLFFTQLYFVKVVSGFKDLSFDDHLKICLTTNISNFVSTFKWFRVKSLFTCFCLVHVWVSVIILNISSMKINFQRKSYC